jgi:hypothetical protein
MATSATNSDLEKLEQLTFDESDSFEFPPSDMIAYNELRSCADLFRFYREGILDIRPEFQREIVWSDLAQTRFIDSLVKQLPIPALRHDSLQRVAVMRGPVSLLPGGDP